MIKAYKTLALEKLTITRLGNQKNSFGHATTVIGTDRPSVTETGPSHAERRGKAKAV